MRNMGSFNDNVLHSWCNVGSDSIVKQPVLDSEKTRYSLEYTLCLRKCFPIANGYTPENSLCQFIAITFTPQLFEWNEFLLGKVNTEFIKTESV